MFFLNVYCLKIFAGHKLSSSGGQLRAIRPATLPNRPRARKRPRAALHMPPAFCTRASLLRAVVRECVLAAQTRYTSSTCSTSTSTVSPAAEAKANTVRALVAASGLGAYTQLLQRAKTRADARLRDALENRHEPCLSRIDPSSDAVFLLILRIFISFTKQFFSLHSNRVKCDKQILPSVGFEPSTFCIRGKRLTARPRGPHGRERTTSRPI